MPDPSFSSILFGRGEGAVFEVWELLFGANFLSVQKAMLGTMSCRPRPRSVLSSMLGPGEGAVFEAWELVSMLF
jgi:hypothetical protein